MRTFTYRVYFTSRPTAYVSLGGKNAKVAIRQAKQFARSPFGRMTFGRTTPKVLKVERLLNGGVKLLKSFG